MGEISTSKLQALVDKLQNIECSISPGPWSVPDPTQGCQTVANKDGEEIFTTQGYDDCLEEGIHLANLRNMIPDLIRELQNVVHR